MRRPGPLELMCHGKKKEKEKEILTETKCQIPHSVISSVMFLFLGAI